MAWRCTLQGLSDLPAPTIPTITTKQNQGGLWAARVFTGQADSESTSGQLAALRSALQADGIEVDEAQGWTLLRWD